MNRDCLLCRLVEEDYGLEGSGKWFRSKEHNSLVIDAERGLFWWNSQGLSGDAFIYLTKVRKLNFHDAKEYLRKTSFSGTFVHEISDGSEVIVYPKLVEVFHENLLSADKTYFYNRTITDETISRFRLGYNQGFYTIPIYQDGLLRQFQMRRDSPKLIKNYYKGVGPLLFNSDILKLTNKIYLTEGLIGAIVLSQNGIPAVAMNVGCDSFMTDWVKYFLYQKEVYVLFDHDKAGETGAKRVANILGQYKCKLYNMWDFEGTGFAVDDYFIEGGTKEELVKTVEANSKYVFELEKGYLTKAK
jgi:DNA primase